MRSEFGIASECYLQLGFVLGKCFCCSVLPFKLENVEKTKKGGIVKEISYNRWYNFTGLLFILGRWENDISYLAFCINS
jgi:hypothetical protein